MERIAVLLAGGSGTRLYPASRRDRPKQFLSFDDGQSLVAATAARVGFADRVVVVSPERYVERVREHVPDADVLVEPASSDTGPAVVYAAHALRERFGECVLWCLPTDHYIGGDIASVLVDAAAVAVERGELVTVGVSPTRAATGYGYIEPGEQIGETGGYVVSSFHEKPDDETAEQYVADGWLWNAGMFAWTPDALLGAARESSLAPLVEALEAGEAAAGYDAVPSVSVDHAILEESSDVVVVPTEVAWDDVGSWDAVGRVFGEDLAAESVRIDAAGTVVASDEAHVSVVGVEDVVVAAYGDRVLVCPRDAAERVREVVAALQE